MVAPLFEKLQVDALAWRKQGYTGTEFSLIGEILRWQFGGGPDAAAEESIPLRYLRDPQFRALEVYWWLRLRCGTPGFVKLYQRYYGSKQDFVEAIGAPHSREVLEYADMDRIVSEIQNPDWASERKIEALHESATLLYPSYIFALAMGAGKTVLIGSIIASEFAMSLRYPDGGFMKNALVFAPGTTILESLREISEMPFSKILPPSVLPEFFANLKIEYPHVGVKDIQARPGSAYNLIVTNTEKIRLRAKTRRYSRWTELQFEEKQRRAELEANLRLQRIASLPSLGVFSDEAHHTYGNKIGTELKRVRETVNYIHDKTPIISVINTTGTPYFERKPIKDVVFWYSLDHGIQDRILKDLCDGIQQYDIGERGDDDVIRDIILRFFRKYGEIKLPNGARAKIAFYFKTQEHLNASRAVIERAMAEIGENSAQILVNTQSSPKGDVDEFNRLNNPENQNRVILLIAKGVEGWNCPSLFACALIKEQTSSIFVLQAATRCLRQVPGNIHSASIFLDWENTKILDRELQNNFKSSLTDLRNRTPDMRVVTLQIRKSDLPKLEVTQMVKRVVPSGRAIRSIVLHRPDASEAKELSPTVRTVLTPAFGQKFEILRHTGEIEELPLRRDGGLVNCHTAAHRIASRYHLRPLETLDNLDRLYPGEGIPETHLEALFDQVSSQQANYETVEEKVTEALALIKVIDEDGEPLFEQGEDGLYVHRLRVQQRSYDRMIQHTLLASKDDFSDARDLSFHYDPYNLDSKPERDFFSRILGALQTDPDDVESFLFTGGLTDPAKTDFHFEYMGQDGRFHNYYPDFVLVKKNGEFYIVEVKSEDARHDHVVQEKAKAVEKLQALQPDKFRYKIVYAEADTVRDAEIAPVVDWVTGSTTNA